MKHLLLTCISLSLCLVSWADTPIKLKNKENSKEKHYSVPVISPVINHEHNRLLIYQEMSLPNLTILIYDEQGDTIHAETTTISANIPYILTLPDVNGVYTIELINDEYHFTGQLIILNEENNPNLLITL
ncbi:DUF3244 domain-containing protein [uncultured Bacteroides sp.]|uniref:DUF3244 domain-containing protein n=1 Tax=uncultured Bacteroides sp. TaxID=162156 RepID=UPI0025E4D33D|nr:DUF3244 domain-containing protein [uncultured Bacteroides sp.]